VNFHVVAGLARIRGLRGATGAACLLLLAACGGAPKPVVTTVNGSMVAAPQLNPTESRRAAPLQVRVYELKTAAAFNGADFMALYQNDQATLGADVVTREELMLQPNENRPIKKTVSADTKFIGVVGAYRLIEKATWRVVVPVQTGKEQTLTIRAGENALSADIKVQP